MQMALVDVRTLGSVHVVRSTQANLSNVDHARNVERRAETMKLRKPDNNELDEETNGETVEMGQPNKAYLSEEQDDWDLHLQCIASAYNSTTHESTGLTPNMMILGREVRRPAELQYPQVRFSAISRGNESAYVEVLRSKLMQAHEVARKHIGKEARRSKEINDAKALQYQYEVGDAVWCLQESRRVGIAPTLQKAYDGPFLIVQKRSTLNYVLQLDKAGTRRLVHNDKITPYRNHALQKWLISSRAAAKAH